MTSARRIMMLTKKTSLTILASLSAWMVKLVDTLVSGTSARKGVEVRVLFQAKKLQWPKVAGAFFFFKGARTGIAASNAWRSRLPGMAI